MHLCSRIVVVPTLLLLLLLVMVEGFGRPRNHKYHRRKQQSWKTIMKHCNSSSWPVARAAAATTTTNGVVDYDPHYKCHLVEFGVVQKIPYDESSDDADGAAGGYNNRLLDVDFSSACVRCGICLAVAQKINETLMDVHDVAAASLNQQWLENDQVDLVLDAVCNQQFRRYALREMDGKRYIGDDMPGAMLVATSADGHWESNLKNKCRDMVKRAGSRELYKHWRDWWCETGGSSADVLVADLVCRSNETAGLGDCRSIQGDGSQPENCQHLYRADIKLTARLGSHFF